MSEEDIADTKVEEDADLRVRKYSNYRLLHVSCAYFLSFRIQVRSVRPATPKSKYILVLVV